MLRRIKNFGLGTLLGLGACTYVDFPENIKARSSWLDRENYIFALKHRTPSSLQVSDNSKRNSQNLGKSQIYTRMKYPIFQGTDSLPNVSNEMSASLGLVKLSASPNQDAIKIKFPYVPAVEIPFSNKPQYTDLRFEQELYDASYFPFEDGWIVGNRIERNQENGEVPLNVLGKVIKKYILENVRPVREVSKAVSRPVRVVFGENARFDVYENNGNMRARLRLGNNFGERWDWDYRLEIQSSTDKELGAVLTFGVKSGEKKQSKPLFRDGF
jgi:hypothetical protein